MRQSKLQGARVSRVSPSRPPQTLRGPGCGFRRGGPCPAPAEAGKPSQDVFVVQRADGGLAPHTQAEPAQLMVRTRVAVPGLKAEGADQAPELSVCSSLAKLHEQASLKTLDEYAALCGVARGEIEDRKSVG